MINRKVQMELSQRALLSLAGVVVLVAAAIAALTANAFATHSSTNAPARTIPYQGTLAENQQPVTRQETVTFELYDNPACQSAFWTEQQDVDVVDGRFAVQLGVVSAFERHAEDDPFAKPELYLGVTVDNTSLSGCQKIVAAPRAIHADNGVPAGNISPFGGPDSNVPPGWLLCDGRGLRGSEYKQLFDAIGTSWGDGTDKCPGGGCDFNLPDLQGYFLRGVDRGTGRDPGVGGRYAAIFGGNTGDGVGSLQDDAVKSHSHDAGSLTTNTSGAHSHEIDRSRGTGDSSIHSLERAHESNRANVHTHVNGAHTHDVIGSTATEGSMESRPKNAYVNYIIKH